METEKTTLEEKVPHSGTMYAVERATIERTLLALQWLWVNAKFAPCTGWEDQGARVMKTVDELRRKIGLPDADWNAIHQQHETAQGRNTI